MHRHSLINHTTLILRSHGTSTERLVLTAKALLPKSVHFSIIELVKAWLKCVAAVFEMSGQRRGTSKLVEVEHGWRIDMAVTTMREIVWIDCLVDKRVRKGVLYNSTRGGVVKHSKEGKVVPGESDRVWRKKDADISSKLGR